MDGKRLKQRLVGAVILVALAVILLPMLLSDEDENQMPLFGTNIPEQPKVLTDMAQLSPENFPERPAYQPLRTMVDEHNAKASDTPESSPEKKPLPDEDAKLAATTPKVEQITRPTKAQDQEKKNTAHAWVVQVGSFSQADNALALRNKLRKKQFPAFVEAITTPEGKIYRVRVGPEVQQRSANKLQRRLKKEMAMKGLVMRHP